MSAKVRSNEYDPSSNGVLPNWDGPAILLLDLDAFFASVEQFDHPEWRGKPVIVGGDPAKRGVVSTCSYEARVYGVRSAMPSSTAAKLCPDAIWTHGNFARYKEMSQQVMDIIRDETPLVEQVSIDEAFADITPNRTNREHPILVAKRIQDRVSELGVTCSIGLGTTKSIAKIASEKDKPRGLTAVFPGTEHTFLAGLPIKVVSGIGPVAQNNLQSNGIFTLQDLVKADDDLLERILGKSYRTMKARAAGNDVSEVSTNHEVKSVSHEITFAVDLKERGEIESTLIELLTQVGRRLRMKGLSGTTLMLKMKYDDGSTHTAQRKLIHPSDDDIELRPVAFSLIDNLWRPGIKVRLLGVGVSGFNTQVDGQLNLFGSPNDDGTCDEAYEDDVMISDKDKRERLLSAFDELKDRFGESAVNFGSSMKNSGNTTGSSSKNPADYK